MTTVHDLYRQWEERKKELAETAAGSEEVRAELEKLQQAAESSEQDLETVESELGAAIDETITRERKFLSLAAKARREGNDGLAILYLDGVEEPDKAPVVEVKKVGDYGLHGTNIDNQTPLWEFETQFGIRHQAEDAARHYAAGLESVQSIDRFTGESLWEAWSSPEKKQADHIFDIRLAYGHLVVTGKKWGVAALSRKSGHEKWRSATTSDMQKVIFDSEKAYVINGEGITAVDLQSGEAQWKFDRQVNGLQLEDGVLYASLGRDRHSCHPAKLCSIDIENGEQRWEYDLGKYRWIFEPVDENLLLVRKGAHLVSLDAHTGEERGNFNSGDWQELYGPVVRGEHVFCRYRHNAHSISYLQLLSLEMVPKWRTEFRFAVRKIEIEGDVAKVTDDYRDTWRYSLKDGSKVE